MNKQLLGLIISLTIIAGGFLLLDSPFQDFVGRNVPEVKGVKSTNMDKVEKVKVARLVDGDTIVLTDGRKIRYLYIDTPETVKENVPVMCFGPEAKEMNEKLVLGKEIWMLSDKESKDQYGRDLRMIFLAGTNTDDFANSVNAILIKGGFARARIFKPNTLHESEAKQLERDAKDKKLGVWGMCPQPFVE